MQVLGQACVHPKLLLGLFGLMISSSAQPISIFFNFSVISSQYPNPSAALWSRSLFLTSYIGVLFYWAQLGMIDFHVHDGVVLRMLLGVVKVLKFDFDYLRAEI